MINVESTKREIEGRLIWKEDDMWQGSRRKPVNSLGGPV